MMMNTWIALLIDTFLFSIGTVKYSSQEYISITVHVDYNVIVVSYSEVLHKAFPSFTDNLSSYFILP